ncbi:MAG: hypothetical protein OXJ37_11145 [Bryobacterales bacterium]|nr:hypothetical protein [Bryobacterales bacterium]
MRLRSHSRLGCSEALIAASLAAASVFAGPASAQIKVGRQPDASVILPTGQRITPAGTQVVVNSMPIAAAESRDGQHLLVLQSGYETPSISVLDLKAKSPHSRVELADAWLGLVLSEAGDRLFVSGGARQSVWELSFRSGELRLEREFPIPGECSGNCSSLIGDVLFDRDDRTLYVLDVLRDRVVVVNSQSGLVLGEFKTGIAPYRARQTPDGEHLLISHWGEASVGLYRLADRRLVERIPVGEHPTDLEVVVGEVQVPGEGEDEVLTYPARLFVACAHSDNLWTYGITSNNRFELLDARSVAPRPDSPVGSLPSALGVSKDKRTLYIANAGNNIVLAVNIEEGLPEPQGALPTGWFPTAVVGLEDGALAYLSGKGDSENPGLVGRLPPLTSEQLEFLTAAAVQNLPGPETASSAPPEAVKHVVLVLTDVPASAWQELLEDSAHLKGYVAPTREQLGQIAWLTGGIATDFFAKLGPAVHAGRLSAQDLAQAGRAAAPAAGTLWTNARQASISTETYGIAGGRPPSAFVANLEAEGILPRLAVVRLSGSGERQATDLGRLLSALQDHEAYAATAIFAVSTGEQAGAAVSGGAVQPESTHESLIAAPALVSTIEWLLGLRPMTQADSAAPRLTELFEPSR